MVDIKPIPPTASAEGETAAIQAQIIETGASKTDTVVKAAEKSVDLKSENKKASDAGLKNYFVSNMVAA